MFFEKNEGEIVQCDTIEYEGKFWLVGEWLDSPELGVTKPKRLICLETLPHQKTIGSKHGDFVLNHPIPREVFDGQIPQKSEVVYVVVEDPDIQEEGAKGLH